tara:strand:+ start:70 stop:222 length:153 start_codon:yes stop_codon:yes gene_type:complete
MTEYKKLINNLFPLKKDYNQWVVNVLKDIRQKKYSLNDIITEMKKQIKEK